MKIRKIVQGILALAVIIQLSIVVSFSAAQQQAMQETKSGTVSKSEESQVKPKQTPAVPSKQVRKEAKPQMVAELAKNLFTVEITSMSIATLGEISTVDFSIREEGSCEAVTNYRVWPKVKFKAGDGSICELEDRIRDERNSFGEINLSCDELRGSLGAYLYNSRFNCEGAAWNQMGICLEKFKVKDNATSTECTWFPISNQPAFFLKKN